MRVRLFIPEVVLGVFLTLSIFSLGWVVSSARYSPTNQETKTQTSEGKEGKKPGAFSAEWFTNDAPGFFAAVSFLVTAIQAGLVIWQLILIRRSLKPASDAAVAANLSARSLIRAERAQLLVDEIKVHNIRDIVSKSSVPEISYVINNYGRTIAWTTRTCFAVTVNPESFYLPLEPDYTNATVNDTGFPVPPNGGKFSSFKFDVNGAVIDAAAAKAVIDGTGYLFVFGYVDYTDAFIEPGSAYRAGFCYWCEVGATEADDRLHPSGTRAYWLNS